MILIIIFIVVLFYKLIVFYKLIYFILEEIVFIINFIVNYVICNSIIIFNFFSGSRLANAAASFVVPDSVGSTISIVGAWAQAAGAVSILNTFTLSIGKQNSAAPTAAPVAAVTSGAPVAAITSGKPVTVPVAVPVAAMPVAKPVAKKPHTKAELWAAKDKYKSHKSDFLVIKKKDKDAIQALKNKNSNKVGLA